MAERWVPGNANHFTTNKNKKTIVFSDTFRVSTFISLNLDLLRCFFLKFHGHLMPSLQGRVINCKASIMSPLISSEDSSDCRALPVASKPGTI